MTRTLAIAHRGFSARFSENTLTAYRAAIDAGADIVESDARLSKDGIVWCCHDATLARLTGDSRAIADLTSAELSAIVLPGPERLTTLREVLARIAPERPVLIDVKTDAFDLIDAILRDVADAGAVDRVWIGMRSAPQLGRARARDSGLSLLAFLPDYAQADTFETAGADALRIWEGDLDRPDAAALLERKTVFVTAGGRGTSAEVGDTTAEGLRRILHHRPKAVLLNDPSLLTGFAAARKPASPARP
ncbi:MAG: glycerophosphodiester phosphodiesterase family protein [Microvirga sp.]